MLLLLMVFGVWLVVDFVLVIVLFIVSYMCGLFYFVLIFVVV